MILSKKTMEIIVRELEMLAFTVRPSSSNFVFARPADGDAKSVFEKLRAKEIYVRYFSKERTKEFLRITIGTDKQMERMFEALES